jgi:hypothetical protein
MFSPDSKALMYASRSGELLAWDTSSWASTSTVTLGEEYRLLNFELEGKLLIGLTNETNTLTLWDPIAGTKMGTIRGGDKEIYDYVISPDGKMLATIFRDDTTLWSLPSCNQLQSLPHPYGVRHLAFSPTGPQIATSLNREITLWDAYDDWLSDEEARMDLGLEALHQEYTKKPYSATLAWLQHHDRYKREENFYERSVNRGKDEDDVLIRAFSELAFEREPEAIIKTSADTPILALQSWPAHATVRCGSRERKWKRQLREQVPIVMQTRRHWCTNTSSGVAHLKRRSKSLRSMASIQDDFKSIPTKLEEPLTDEMKETLTLRSQKIHALSMWILHSTMTAALAKRLLHHKQIEDAKARWEADRLISQHHAAERAAWVSM